MFTAQGVDMYPPLKFFFSGEFVCNDSLPFLNIFWIILMSLDNCDVSFVENLLTTD